MRTAVIADDSPTMRRIVTRVLEAAHWRVVVAEDGVQALQAVFAEQPDVVVLDVQMPRLSGWVTTRILKEDWATSDLPVLLLTSLDAASDRYWGDKAGGDRYLTKDFQPAELAEAVDELVHARPRGKFRADPVVLSDDDVLEKTTEVLDRALFQTSLAADVTAVSSTTHGFEATVAALLDVLSRVVDHHLAGVVLREESGAWLTVAHDVSQEHFRSFLQRAGEALECDPAQIEARVSDPHGHLGADDDADLATFLSMPLRGYGGAVIGVLALSSSRDEAFGESALTTLRLVEGPAALVVDAARLTERRLAAPAPVPAVVPV